MPRDEPSRGRALLLGAFALLLGGCAREEREFRTARVEREQTVAQSELHPGEGIPPRRTTNPLSGNAQAIAEGRHLYVWFNCAGCHFNGGGGIGPPLMDEQWIYGSNPQNLYQTILEGRPNGMPSFRGRLNETQVWQIVAYLERHGGRPLRSSDSRRPTVPPPERDSGN